jgi:hypothetical protein
VHTKWTYDDAEWGVANWSRNWLNTLNTLNTSLNTCIIHGYGFRSGIHTLTSVATRIATGRLSRHRCHTPLLPSILENIRNVQRLNQKLYFRCTENEIWLPLSERNTRKSPQMSQLQQVNILTTSSKNRFPRPYSS